MSRFLFGCAASLALTPTAWAENLYGTTTDDLVSASDRYAHPRSIEEYRRIVPAEADMYGMCRNAGHLDQCIWRLNGHHYPPPPKWLQTFKHN